LPILAPEIESGLVDLELARALPRHRLLTRTWLLAMLSIAGAVALMGTGTVLGAGIFGTGSMEMPSASPRASLLLNLAATASCFTGFALLVATLSKRWSTAFTTAALTAVVLYLLDFLAIGWPPVGGVRGVSPLPLSS